MAIELKFKKVIKNGKKLYECTGYKMLQLDELPEDISMYNGHCLVYSMSGEYCTIFGEEGAGLYHLQIGYFYTEDSVKEIIRICTKAGERLKKFNQRSWAGEELIII